MAVCQVSAPPKSVKAGDSFVLTATPLDYRGGFILGHTVQWSTSDVGVAIVTASGWVATLGPGSVVLQATCEKPPHRSASTSRHAAPAPKRAKPNPFPSPQNSPAPEERSSGQTAADLAHRQRWFLAGSLGVLIISPCCGSTVGCEKWHSIPPSGPGGFRLRRASPPVDRPTCPQRAILRGAAASVTIERRPVERYSSGLPRGLWRRSGILPDGLCLAPASPGPPPIPRVAQVDSATGLVHAVGPGRARVVAASGELRASTAILVRRPPVETTAAASVSIAPPDSLRVGDTITLAAAALDEIGAPLADRQVSWTSSEPGIAAVEARTGRVRGYAPGTATIVARSGSKTASSQLTVFPADISPDTLTVQAYEPESESEEPEQPAPRPTSLSRSADARGGILVRLGAVL